MSDGMDLLDQFEAAVANKRWDDNGASRAELAAVRGQIEDFINDLKRYLPDFGQLMYGWHGDGTAWTEWDEEVRQRHARLHTRLYELFPGRPPAAPPSSLPVPRNPE